MPEIYLNRPVQQEDTPQPPPFPAEWIDEDAPHPESEAHEKAETTFLSFLEKHLGHSVSLSDECML